MATEAAHSRASTNSWRNWKKKMSSLAAVNPLTTALNPSNPFPGLRPYEEADAAWFFGRGREINELLKRLRRVRFLAVVGPSGCGKSSLVKAGILPGVRDGYLDAEWRIATFRPGERPLDNLAQAVSFQEALNPSSMRNALDRGSLGLVEAIQEQRLPAETNILIVADQFEELFQFVQRRGDAAQDEAKAFLKLLLAAAACDTARVYVVITMRLEWLNECATYTGLAEAINEGIYLVPQMSRRQFQQAILAPIEAAEGSITSSLLDRMLNDLDGRADQLPVLQHALMRMWQRRRSGEPLSLSTYEAVGTLSDCLSNHAEEIFGELTKVKRDAAAEALFRSITQVFKNRKVRRPRPLREIEQDTGVPIEQLKTVAEEFRKEGRSFLMTTPGGLAPDSIVDISHEALIRQWSRLAIWVENEAEEQARIARLEDIAAEWNQDREKYKEALFRGLVLKQAEELKPRLARGSAGLAFLEASRNAELIRRWLWRGLIGLLVLAVVLVPVLGTLYKLRQKEAQAQSDRKIADMAQEQAARERAYRQDVAELVRQIKKVEGRSPQAYEAIQASVNKIQAKRVYIQYSGPRQLALAKALQSDLVSRGYSVPGYEDVGSKAPSQTQVRYFHDGDKAEAEAIVRLVKVTGTVVAQPIPNTRNLAPVGQFEVWLAASASAAAQSRAQ
jgi:energy-coupling factor transporter ATP-binding protein EcfA2